MSSNMESLKIEEWHKQLMIDLSTEEAKKQWIALAPRLWPLIKGVEGILF